MSDFDIAVNTVTETNVVIGQLRWGRTYWFRVRAYNHACTGEPGPVSKAVVILEDLWLDYRVFSNKAPNKAPTPRVTLPYYFK